MTARCHRGHVIELRPVVGRELPRITCWQCQFPPEEDTMHEPIVGKHHFPNGWTASVIDDGYGRDHGLFEVWAWHKDGRQDDDVQGWLSEDEARAFVASVEARP